MSSPLYAPHDDLEDNPEDEHEVGDLEDEQGEEDRPEEEPDADTVSCDELQDAQHDDESLEIVGEVNKTVPLKTPIS